MPKSIELLSILVLLSVLAATVNRRDGDELYNLVKDPNETTNVIATHPEQAARMLKSITAWDESLPPLSRPTTSPNRKARRESPQPKKHKEQKCNPQRETVSTAKTSKTESILYPSQNYSGPLQQNWFELHDGLKNSQYIFESTKEGTVAFVGGSITGMPWRKKVMENLKRRFPKPAHTQRCQRGRCLFRRLEGIWAGEMI